MDDLESYRERARDTIAAMAPRMAEWERTGTCPLSCSEFAGRRISW